MQIEYLRTTGAGCNNAQEAESAIPEVLETLWEELGTGRRIKDIRAYAFTLLKRAAPRHWHEFDGLVTGDD